jgi:hypothetical protein
MLMVRVQNANKTDGSTVNNMTNVLMYIEQQTVLGTSIVVGGGAGGNNNLYCTPVITGALGADSIVMTVVPAVNMFFSVKLLQLAGILPGFNA